MSETEAVLLERSLRSHPQESALEQGWWLAEMQQRYGYGLEELARRNARYFTTTDRLNVNLGSEQHQAMNFSMAYS